MKLETAKEEISQLVIAMEVTKDQLERCILFEDRVRLQQRIHEISLQLFSVFDEVDIIRKRT